MDSAKAEQHILRSLTGALAKKKQGNSKDYERLIKALEASPPTTLVFWFRALVKCISLVDPGCIELITVLLRYQYDAGDIANQAFEKMILNLVSCNQRFLSTICEKISMDLLPPTTETSDDESTPIIQVSDLTGPFAEPIAIQLLSVSPTAPTYLFESMTAHFPNKVNDALALDQYTMHMLSIAKHCLVLRERILEFLVHQIIEIDAEISIPDDEETEDMFFDLDESFHHEKTASTRALDMADKLDNIMNRVFDFCYQQHESGKSPEEIFRGQLRVFDSSILPTQKSKHPQFIIFFLCSQSAAYCQQFLGYLVQKTTDAGSSIFVKTTSIGYIASFIARATFVSPSLVHSALITLCTWALTYARENANENGDYDKHLIFYHLCQAIFYMFCFRLEQILDRTTKDEYLSIFKIIDIVQCSLNPFRFCSPIVVKELTDVSYHLRITQLTKACEEVIARNNAIVTPNTVIEASFPFDPYLLKNSSQWINDCYCSWEGRSGPIDDTHSEEFVDLSSSVPDDFDVMMSFTPDASYDIGMHFPRSPVF